MMAKWCLWYVAFTAWGAARSYASIEPFVSSLYFQKQKVKNVFPILDISLEQNLIKVVEGKAYKNELIFYAFNSVFPWLDFAVSLANQLEHVGYDHAVAIGLYEDCVALQRVRPNTACATYTLTGEYWQKERKSIDYMWISRYAASTAAARTGTGVLVLDLDCILRRDVYADLKAPPHASAQLIHMEEGWANGGLFYMAPSLPADSPTLWVHNEVFRRADIIRAFEHNESVHLGTAMDQALLNDAINSAATWPDGSARDWPSVYVTGKSSHSHTFWQTNDRGNISRRVDGDTWYKSRWSVRAAGSQASGHAVAHGFSAEKVYHNQVADHGRWSMFQNYKLKNAQFKSMELRIPADAEPPPVSKRVEIFAAGLPYTFANSEFEHYGWPVAAVTHLVAATSNWDENGGWTHCGRRALLAAAGVWQTAPEDERYVTLSHSLVQKQDLETKPNFTRLLKRFFDASYRLQRKPALFGFLCSDAPWLKEDDKSRLGVYDTRVVKHDHLCYPAPAGANCWHTAYVYDFELSRNHVAARTLHSFEDASGYENHHVVRLRHLPAEVRNVFDERIKNDCSGWLK